MENNIIKIGAIASLWSPSVSFKIWQFKTEIGAEVISAGAIISAGSNGISIKASGVVGFSFGIYLE